jgi:hypothetical protein
MVEGEFKVNTEHLKCYIEDREDTGAGMREHYRHIGHLVSEEWPEYLQGNTLQVFEIVSLIQGEKKKNARDNYHTQKTFHYCNSKINPSFRLSFLPVLGFELKASHLIGRPSII